MKWNPWKRLGAFLVGGFIVGMCLGLASAYSHGGDRLASFAGYFGAQLAVLSGMIWMLVELTIAIRRRGKTKE